MSRPFGRGDGPKLRSGRLYTRTIYGILKRKYSGVGLCKQSTPVVVKGWMSLRKSAIDGFPYSFSKPWLVNLSVRLFSVTVRANDGLH
jgi:hypothetical protein